MSSQNLWDDRLLRLAQHISLWSKDPSTKVGAVIVDEDRRIISLGYNGLPMGVEDTYERLHNRELKYKTTVHAERNALIFAQRSLKGCTLFTWPFMPCSVCAAMVIQAGITRVISLSNDNERWIKDFELSHELFSEAGVQVDLCEMFDPDPPPLAGIRMIGKGPKLTRRQFFNPLTWFS